MDDTSEKKGTSWWIPAATFVVGLLLGGGVIAATMSGGDTTSGSAASSSPSTTADGPTPSPSPSGPADATLTLPGECLEIADESERVLALVNDAVAAARDLDAGRLSDLVREIQSGQETLAEQTTSCRESVEAPVIP